jgi:hypothetical protein
MTFYKNKKKFLILSLLVSSCVFGYRTLCHVDNNYLHKEEVVIVGGGIIGGMEAYYAHLNAKKNNLPLRITIYEKNSSISETTVSNIVPSLTCDEILSVVPRGQELVKKLEILFSQPGGIKVDDVANIHGTTTTEEFKKEVQNYSLDEEGHAKRTQDLLALGKMSMELWKEIFNNADAEFKSILECSNFNSCREPLNSNKVLRDGYRIDLIYNIANAKERAESMIRDYAGLGYKHCSILTPSEVIAIDPFLKDFCISHSKDDVWNNDTVALWRPGGCFDAQCFLPKLYEYLKKKMGTYTNAEGKKEDCFQIKFGKKVTAIEFANDNSGKTLISGLKFDDGETILKDGSKCCYVFCPGEAVGTLKKLELSEPAYAGFAGVSLLLDIDIPEEKLKEYSSFNHCMEVHQVGVVLAWQARFRNNKIFIGVAGTKSFYGDQRPTKDQDFARNRNLLQLNMINDVLPEFISLALKYDTKGKTLTEKDLQYLETNKIATRWAGVRAVVYDGFPTLGHVFKNKSKVENARCTTHLGSGGGSFAPAAVVMSRNSMNDEQDDFTKRILNYGDSSRTSTSK